MGTNPRGLLRGPKFNGKHTTLIVPAQTLVELLREDDRVTKIVIGVIKQRKAGNFSLKAVIIEAGLRLQITGPSSVQQLFAYTADPEAVKADLEKAWQAR